MMSRLPQDPGYWEMLTDRIVADTFRNMSRGWLRDIASFAMPLAIGAAAAVIVSLLWRPEMRRQTAQDSARMTLYGFVPADPLANALLTSGTAPTIATLIAISERKP